MSTDRNVRLPLEIWSRMSEAARAEGKSVDALLEEAALRLLQVLDLRSFVSQNREWAQQKGLPRPIFRGSLPRLAKRPPGDKCCLASLRTATSSSLHWFLEETLSA
jgi:hypothetical protein